MPVGKGIDRTDLRGLNRGEVAENDACHVVRGGSRQTILTHAAGERPRTLKLGTASADKGPKLAPGKVMGTLCLGRAEFQGSDFQEPSTGSLEMPAKHSAAVVEKHTHALPEGRRGERLLSETGSAVGKSAEDMASHTTAGCLVASP